MPSKIPPKPSWNQLDPFTRGYIDCALWASSGEHGGASFEQQGYTYRDLADVCARQMIKDCKLFQAEGAPDLADKDDEESGRNFWLSRNRSGSGFWDRGYGPSGDRLTRIAYGFGTADLYLDEDSGEIYCT